MRLSLGLPTILLVGLWNDSEAGNGFFGFLRGRSHGGAEEPEIEPRIVGGTEVDPSADRYPYFALMWGEGICGGALITPSIVITAAHCKNAADSVTLGVQSRETEWFGEYDSIDVETKVVHPLHGTDGYAYDLMVMKLVSPSDQPYVRLNTNRSVPIIEQQLRVMGFGDIVASSSKQVIPDVLNEVGVEYVTQSACDLAYGDNLIRPDMLCAAEDGKDGCAGDSGGPLIIKGATPALDVLVGTVAWGRGCADPRYPGVYSRMSYFYKWIVKQVCTLSPHDAPDYMACVVPTQAPSPMPAGGQPEVRNAGWNSENERKRGFCEGDCDSDDDCEDGLICFQRSRGEEIPGCALSPESTANFYHLDVCVYA